MEATKAELHGCESCLLDPHEGSLYRTQQGDGKQTHHEGMGWEVIGGMTLPAEFCVVLGTESRASDTLSTYSACEPHSYPCLLLL